MTSDLLVTLAALKSQLNEGQTDLVKQFMPMIGHAISRVQEPFVTEAELQKIIFETMSFQIPYGAIRLFINRASSKKYNYIVKNPDRTFSPNRTVLSGIGFDNRLRQARTHQLSLLRSFKEYCRSAIDVEIDESEAENYFFEVLFDIAPEVMRSLASPDNYSLPVPSESDIYKDVSSISRYRVYRFLTFCIEQNNIELQYVEEFIHGAVMAESLFYSTPNEALHRMTDVLVYFDTPILLAALGLANEAETKATRELIDLLKILKARVRCFDETLKELHGIVYAVRKGKEDGRQYTFKPGDVGDIINRKRIDLAELTVIVDNLEDHLAKAGIKCDTRPIFHNSAELGIDEMEFARRIESTGDVPRWREASSTNYNKRLQHDINCVRAIYEIRDGKAITSLERCKAIFVTNASVLVSVTAEFFKDHDEEFVSSVPLCVGSSVFTMLMWLKATDRKPNITKDRLVANSIAALMPSQEAWSTFVSMLQGMLERGEIDQSQFAYIANAMETRTILMSETEGDVSAITEGTVEDVRQKVMGQLITGKEDEIAQLHSKINDITAAMQQKDNIISDQNEKIVKLSLRHRQFYRKLVWNAFRSVVTLVFLGIFIIDVYGAFISGEYNLVRIILVAVGTVLSVLSLFVIAPWRRSLRRVSDRFVERIESSQSSTDGS